MQPQDVFNRNFDATTKALDQWLATIADDAVIEREQTAGYWRVRLKPHQPNACAIELMLSRQQIFDIEAGSESVVAQPIADLSMFLPLLEAIAAGRVRRRTWCAVATGTPLAHELVVQLSADTDWSMRRAVRAGTATTETTAIARDHSYIAYRRS